VTSTEASALATAPVAVRGARLALAPRTDEATLLVRAAGLAAAAAADVEDAVAQTLDMFVGDETCEGSDAVYDAHTRRRRGARGASGSGRSYSAASRHVILRSATASRFGVYAISDWIGI